MENSKQINLAKWEIPARRYPVQNIVSLLIRLSAIIPIFFAILFVFTTEADGNSPGVLMLVLCAGCIAGLILYAAGSMIRLVMEIATIIARLLEQTKDSNRDN